MERLRVEGGRVLSGTWKPQGAKNEAAMVLCAALLTAEPVVVYNCPIVKDIEILLELLVGLGVSIDKKGTTVRLQCRQVCTSYLESARYRDLFSSVRVAVNLIGPLLSRLGYVEFPSPGGDRIGARRMDTLLNSLADLGCGVEYQTSKRCYEIQERLTGKREVILDEASVTGTASLIMLAAGSESHLHISHAACEPYIVQLCRMLNRMGASIDGVGCNVLTVKGKEELSGTDHTVAPDIIEIGSLMAVAATTGSKFLIECGSDCSLGVIPRVFSRVGVSCHVSEKGVMVDARRPRAIESFTDGSILTIADSVWPGFPTDLLPLILVAAINANGTALFYQKMYEARLHFVSQLKAIGARVTVCDPHRVIVHGTEKVRLLSGLLRADDIRSGMALLATALATDGVSVLDGADQIDRGYVQIDSRLRAMGAHVERIK